MFIQFFIVILGFLLLSCRNSNILRINPLSGVWFYQYFSHSVDCLFILLTVSFDVQKLSVWCSLIYLFMLHFRCHSHKIIAKVSWLYTHILFLTLYSIPSAYKFLCVPIQYVFDYCSFIIQFEIRTHNVSSFVLFPRCFGYFWSFVSYELWTVFLFLEKKCHWEFDRDCNESVNYFG